MKKTLTALLTTTLVIGLVGCKNSDTESTTASDKTIETNQSTNEPVFQATKLPENVYGTYNEKSLETDYDESEATLITGGIKTEISGTGATEKNEVITITKGGTYILTGEYQGQIKVNVADENVRIILNNFTLTSTSKTPMFIEQAKNVYLTLADGTTNTMSDSEETKMSLATDEEAAVILSKDDLFINGTGSLVVNAYTNNGIQGKDDVTITGGSISVNALNNGIKGKDSVSILDGNINISTESGDGIQASNAEDETKGWIALDGGKLNIHAGRDGIQAEQGIKISQVEVEIQTADGEYTNGLDSEESYKGLKAGRDIVIDQGTFTIHSADDSIHANGNVTINNGTFELASADDAIHADDELAVNKGEITVSTSYEGFEGSIITVAGGTHVINASDDGINASGGNEGEANNPPGQADESKAIKFTGGTVFVRAEGDGVDSNGNVEMSGGTVFVDGLTTGGNGALDYDGSWTQTGGILLASGSQDMAMTPSDTSTQASLGLFLTESKNAAVTVSIGDKTLFSYTPTKSFSHLAISTPEMANNKEITISLGGTITGKAVHGYVNAGQVSQATTLGTYTLTGSVTNLNQDGSTATATGMMGGGPNGGMQPR